MERELPGGEFWNLIRAHTGELDAAEPTVRGFGADFTAVVHCAKGPFFVKAVRNRPGGRRESLIREKSINPAVLPLAPALAWATEDESWIALGFTVVPGRTSDFAPGSSDLDTVTRLVDRIGHVPLPEFASSWREERWDRFAASPAHAALFRGSTLVHGDVNPSNVLISGGDGWLVDWAWPTFGAGFIDPACLVVQLMAAGHDPDTSEQWAERCAGWRTAAPEAVDAFALATVRMWAALLVRRPGADWVRTMHDTARIWARHRGLPADGIG
ncbi:phosphotransferase family protein [Streptomyces sp. LE64]|uniref:phosphotransferase family protein n=1 Tax=Streptomyces sp. LE64 TaxID=3448653 RepID=UPI004043318D